MCSCSQRCCGLSCCCRCRLKLFPTSPHSHPYKEYWTPRVTRAFESFVDDLSNWYVRRSRPRFWKASDPGAFSALYEALTTLAKLLAPFCPFVADEMHQVLGMPEASVHLQDWPVADPSLVDADLEAEMALARRLVALGRAARGDARMKVRQPLRRARPPSRERRSHAMKSW